MSEPTKYVYGYRSRDGNMIRFRVDKYLLPGRLIVRLDYPEHQEVLLDQEGAQGIAWILEYFANKGELPDEWTFNAKFDLAKIRRHDGGEVCQKRDKEMSWEETIK